MNQMVIGGWYSAIYKSEFRITFQVLAVDGKSVSLCRQDGAIVDNLPAGYVGLISHGDCPPDQEPSTNSGLTVY